MPTSRKTGFKGKTRRSRAQRRSRARRGGSVGSLGGNPASAWGWVSGTYGTPAQQFAQTMGTTNDNSGSAQSLKIQPLGDPNAGTPASSSIGPNLTGAIPQNGGRRKGKKGRKQSGGAGILGVINQALVPFGLLGLQQAFGTRKNRKYRKY